MNYEFTTIVSEEIIHNVKFTHEDEDALKEFSKLLSEFLNSGGKIEIK